VALKGWFVSKQDDQFYREFAVIVGFIFVFFFIALFTARGIGAAAMQQSQLAPRDVAERIAPVGKVSFGGAGEMAEMPEPVEVAAAAPQTGEEVYQATCVACHSTGAAGAPKVGDVASWQLRADQGMNVLLDSSINGKGLMQPRAGIPSLSDDDLANAIKYMLDTTGVTAN
jgi:cytochrome c5